MNEVFFGYLFLFLMIIANFYFYFRILIDYNKSISKRDLISYVIINILLALFMFEYYSFFKIIDYWSIKRQLSFIFVENTGLAMLYIFTDLTTFISKSFKYGLRETVKYYKVKFRGIKS